MAEIDSQSIAGHHLVRRESSVNEDYNIQQTNDDATDCKRAAVHMGYYSDPFLDAFYHGKVEKKEPEINRGYWARVRGFRILVDKFLKKAGSDCQIVNLGAGFDTLYWQLRATGAKFSNFTDVDFSTISAKKIHFIVKKGSPLKDLIATNPEDIKVDADHRDLDGPIYHLIGADLRQIKELKEKLNSAGLDPTKPTLFLCECVLVYMSTEQSEELLKTLGEMFSTALFVNYEQVNLADKFGAIMKENLHTRGISLAGMKACRSLEDQNKRYEAAGWKNPISWTMDTVFKELLPSDEIKKIEALELLDEKELLWQLLQHYCISMASKDTMNLGLADISL